MLRNLRKFPHYRARVESHRQGTEAVHLLTISTISTAGEIPSARQVLANSEFLRLSTLVEFLSLDAAET